MASDWKNSTDISLPLIIVNPRSASGSTSGRWLRIAGEFRENYGPFNVAFTESPGDAIVIAEKAAKEGRRFIIACGGDGTINEVANGIILSGTDAELGVLPSGTGGDFRRTLGLPQGIREASSALLNGMTRPMDAGRATFIDMNGNQVSRYFINVSSVGLAADVIQRVKASHAFSWLPLESIRGRANFAFSALQEVLDVHSEMVNIRMDGGVERSIQSIALCIANAKFFGGGMMIAPDAKPNDGLLDVINVGDISTAKILLNGLSLYRGTHQTLDEVKSTVVRTIEVKPARSDTNVMIEIDGELPGKLPAIFEIIPNALRIRVPVSTNNKAC